MISAILERLRSRASGGRSDRCLNWSGFWGIAARTSAIDFTGRIFGAKSLVSGAAETVLIVPCLLLGALGMVPAMAKQVRLTLAKAIAKANLRRAEAGDKPITMNSLAVAAGVATTTITRLGRSADDPKAASALSLDLAAKIVTVLNCGIEDLLEVADQ